MGFLKNLFDEAGSKAGRAIGNKLFPKSTDYIRLGDLNGNSEEAMREQAKAERERVEAELKADIMREVMGLRFDAYDMDRNIEVLSQLDAIIEGLPNRFNRSIDEQRIYKAALAKMKAGIALCRAKDPGNKALAYFADKY